MDGFHWVPWTQYLVDGMHQDALDTEPPALVTLTEETEVIDKDVCLPEWSIQRLAAVHEWRRFLWGYQGTIGGPTVVSLELGIGCWHCVFHWWCGLCDLVQSVWRRVMAVEALVCQICSRLRDGAESGRGLGPSHGERQGEGDQLWLSVVPWE